MFYTLTKEQIDTIKERLYPRQSQQVDFLKSVVVNSYGTDNADNIIQVVFNFKDGSGGQFKVFNNEQAKKYLKLKIFEILSPEMSNEAVNFSKIEDIEAVIQKYGSQYIDITPSLDFNGDKTNINAHEILQDGSILLTYNFQFLLPRPEIDFLSLGVVFYFDKQAYIRDQSVAQQFIDQRILIDKLYIYNVLVNNKVVANLNPIVQDLRILKRGTVKYDLNLLQDLNIEKILKNKLTDSQPKYVSSLFLSRNFNKTLGMIFSIDYQAILEKNTVYNNLIKNSPLKQEYINSCKITSLKINRRKINKKQNNYTIIQDTETSLISSGEEVTKAFVTSVESDRASMAEIALDTSTPRIIRNFAVTDKEVFFLSRGTYQYGVEVQLLDGISQFLSKHTDGLLNDIGNLNKYLEETNKIVKVGLDNAGRSFTTGNYNPQNNCFSEQYIDNFVNSDNDNKNNIIKAITNYISTLQLLGVITQNDQEQYEQSLITMLHPATANIESITYFINKYQKLITDIYRFIDRNKNNNFSFSTWFENDFADTNIPINVGYRFFDFQDYTGLGRIKTNQFNNAIIADLNKYSINPTLDYTDTLNKQYSFISPIDIFSNNKSLQLSALNDSPTAISDQEYIETDIDIKTQNYYADLKLIRRIRSSVLKGDKIITLQMQALALSERFSTTIKNSFSITAKNDKFSLIEERKTDNIGELQLLLELAKQFNTSKKTFLATTKTANTTSVPNYKTDPNIPVHLVVLSDNKCKLLKASDNYLKNINLISKFDLLFNTIHKIEILSYSKSGLIDRWEPLTKQILDGLQQGAGYICRLSTYKNSAYSITGLEEISLPIFNQHFILLNTERIERVVVSPPPAEEPPPRRGIYAPPPPVVVEQPQLQLNEGPVPNALQNVLNTLAAQQEPTVTYTPPQNVNLDAQTLQFTNNPVLLAEAKQVLTTKLTTAFSPPPIVSQPLNTTPVLNQQPITTFTVLGTKKIGK